MAAQTIHKIILIVLLAVFGTLIGLIYVVNQPKLAASAALYLLQRNGSSVVYKELSVDRLRWESWNRLKLVNLRGKCKIQGATYYLSTGDVLVDGIRALVSSEPMMLDVSNLAIVSDSINGSDMKLKGQVYFHFFHYSRFTGDISAARFEYGRYLIEKLETHVKEQDKRLTVSDTHGRFYGGEFALQGFWEYAVSPSYQFNVQLHRIDSSLLADANTAFEQISAIIDGDLQISGNKQKGIAIQSRLAAPSGGSMKASLLRYLARYVPQRQQVEDLIQKDANVSMSKIQGVITSLDRERLSSEVILNSSSLNLNMDVKFSIHVEGGIDSLLEYIHQG